MPTIPKRSPYPAGRNFRPPPYVAPRAAKTNGSVAPVCPISRPETPPAQPGIRVPFVPRAVDLPSALAAINALNTIVTSTEAQIRWLEKYRVTQLVRVSNPDDDSQWVEVLRIVKLVMEDQITGDLWVWELNPTQMSQFNNVPNP